MYTIRKKKNIPSGIKIEDVSDIILNVKEYSEFVPFCKSVSVVDSDPGGSYFIADLCLEVMSMKHMYRSRTDITKTQSGIYIVTTGEPTNILRYLNSKWHIYRGDDCCIVEYDIDLDININIPFLPVEKMLQVATDKIVESFEKRLFNKLNSTL